ncbi:M23 family metallopeptidase [Microbacterium sp. KHB019]|uniref:M23 family metallopeptidase n=1 Tax=Microbacterium sp. KHB019 TaxID=3129770 RepID=UPI00307AA2C9
MGVPAFVVTALARSRTARRIVIMLLAGVTILILVALAPLAIIPMALAGTSLAAPAAAAGDDPTPAARGDWGYPLAGDYFKGRGFGYNPVGGCSYCSTDHQGYDMSQGCGSSIHAAGSGTVITAGSFSGWGNTVRIDHGGGLVTLYGHMQWGSLRVSVGDAVTAGTPVGAEGNTGRSFGCHLHYEVQRAGVAIDPEPFMAALDLPLK